MTEIILRARQILRLLWLAWLTLWGRAQISSTKVAVGTINRKTDSETGEIDISTIDDILYKEIVYTVEKA